jgi:5'-nucleotidase
MGTIEGTWLRSPVRRVSRRTGAATLAVACALLLGACEEEEPPPIGAIDAAVPDAAADAPAGDSGGDSGRMDVGDAGPAVTSNLTILHTNDLHSHLWGHSPEADYTPLTTGDDATLGGFARLAAAIKTQKMSAGTNVLLLDAGDFLMGTPFHITAFTSAPELKLMQMAGYDAAAIGNHEFDFTPAGLAAVLAAFKAGGMTFPLLATNMKFSEASTDDDTLAAFAAQPEPLIRTKLIKTLPNGLKVGMIGLLGAEAQRFAAAARPITFDTQAALVATLTAAVNDLRNNDKVDLVIALSHSGINSNGMGEDRTLAMTVTGIDVIVSGHSHDKLTAPVVQGKTVIVTAGSYGEYLGRLDLEVVKRGATVSEVKVKKYDLLAIDDSIAGDAATQTAVEATITGLDMSLAPTLSYKKVVAETTFDLKRASVAESGLGDLVADAYLAAGRAAQPTEPADFAVEANGQIRADLIKGKAAVGQLWFSDLFKVVPLGTGRDQKPGTPLISYYLNGADIRGGLEVGAAAETIGDVYFLQVAGIEVDYTASRIAFDRVTGARVVKEGMAPVAIDFANTTKCYKVVSTLYIAALFGLVEGLTDRRYSVKPKLKDCTTVVTDLFTLRIDADPAMAEVQELKQWQALLGLLPALGDPDMDMVPNIPDRYMTSQQRIKRTP